MRMPHRSDEELLAECRVETFPAGGPGGQHANRNETAVRLVHVPSGIVVVARRERSQARNRAAALGALRARLAALHHRPKTRTQTRTPRSVKKRVLEAKRHRSGLKELRKRPREE